jgi:hypothetical protein
MTSADLSLGPIPNPEPRWERRALVTTVDRAELEVCLGHPVDEPLTILSGGLANTNVRVGERVVRIHRRDPNASALEARLLARPWASFRVPRVLREGAGFLVLEHVPHGPVLGTREHGAAVGRALAEIHAVTFSSAGDLDPSTPFTRVGNPFSDLVGALVDYARGQLADPSSGLASPLRERADRALEEQAPALRDAAGPPVLCHADFKASNLHWASDGLLVLDWEFAYAGAALSDIGQLLRWEPPAGFVEGFTSTYHAEGGRLVGNWQRSAAVFDLVNLAGLLVNQGGPEARASLRVADVERRIETTLALIGS